MANAELNVILSADGKQLSSTMQKAGKDIQAFDKETKKLPQSFARVDAGISKTANSLNKANTAVKGSKQNFTDLSRVIQDLPFGLIGIQNNLTQLIPGVGFLGLAFSGLLSALTFAQVGMSNWVRGSKETKEEAKEASAETKKLAEEQQHFAEAVDKAAASVIGDAKNIKELRDILISTNSATVQLTQSTIKRGLAQLLFDEKNTELQKILNAEIQKEIQLRKQQNPIETLRMWTNVESTARKANRRIFDLQRNFGRTVFETDAIQNLREMDARIGANADGIRVLNALGKDLGGFFEEFLSDGKKGTDLLDNLLRQVRQFETLINERGLRKANFEIIPTEKRDETIKRAQEFIRNAISRRFEFEVNPKLIVEAPEVVRGQKYFSNLSKESERLIKDLQDEIAKMTKRNPILIEFDRVITEQKARGAELADSLGLRIEGINSQVGLLSKVQREAVNAANTINSVLTPAFSNLFDAIARGENPIKAFFSSIGQAVTQLIQKLIQAAIQATIISAIFPGLTGGAGGFGGLLKSILGFRAEGGPVFANRPYVVGEQGPELFIPKGGGQIIPNNHLNSGLAGVTAGMQTVRVVGEISGRNIRLVSARQGQYDQRGG